MKTKHSFIYLLIGLLALFFANGRWIIPVAAFVAPLFIIRFYRFQKPFLGFLFITLVGLLSNIFIWKGMLPASGFFYYFLMFMMSVFTALTYLIDKVFKRHFKGIFSSLIFPSLYVLMEFIVVSTNPSGSYGTLAHTQSSLPLQQVFSFTGIWGLVFIITWSASIINWLWDNSFERSKLNTSLIIFGIPVFAVLLFGQMRLALNTDPNTVRIASIAKSQSDSLIQDANIAFLVNCEIAVTSGAKIVFGTETVISLQREEENAFIEKAKALAKSKGIYLGLPMQVILEEFPRVLPQNKIVWISPDGKELLTYHKAKPTPGEGNYGDGIIKYFDSKYGRIASAICFDMDFPSLIKQVDDMGIDIMLVPGNDWQEITPYHTYVASARAIEQGFNMVRSTSNGLSASFNYRGQLLSSKNDFKTNELILYSDVPTKGHETVYSKMGNYFAWLCILFLFATSTLFLRNLLVRKGRS